MPRVLLMVLDSLGIGAARDAEKFGDLGADTFGHIDAACRNGTLANRSNGALNIPNLTRLGLRAAHASAHGIASANANCFAQLDPRATFAVMHEQSSGKDTTSGHWEMCGVPVLFDWGYFRERENSFPAELLQTLIARAKLPGVLGNCHASGTEILQRLGRQHLETGCPIVYTSADSVFQIAAHEAHFGLKRLYDACKVARDLLDEHRIARVIARPFLGESPNTFKRTGNRHDYSVKPPQKTLLDHLCDAGHPVFGIGKISDIFAAQGVSKSIHAAGLENLMDATRDTFAHAPNGSLTFVNFVDFDSEYGHRRDVAGYAAALETLDARLPEILHHRGADDLILLTADHGNDPTWPGSDHTRECVPLLALSNKLNPGDAGSRTSFADLGQTIAAHLQIPALTCGIALPQKEFGP